MASFADDDELLEGFDDEDGDSAADEELLKKERAFKRKVDELTAIILKPKKFPAAKRKAAVLMLGELGEPSSIEALVKVYQKDKTPGMKEAAAYALGQMRALEDALELAEDDADIQAHVDSLITGIILEGKLGKRTPVPRRTLNIVAGALLVSFILLMGLGVLLGGSNIDVDAQATAMAAQGTVLPTALGGIDATSGVIVQTPLDAEGVAAALLDYYIALNNDNRALQAQLRELIQGRSPNCAADLLARPTQFNIPNTITQTDLISAADRLNTARTELQPVYDAYANHCSSTTALNAETANNLTNTLIKLQNDTFDIPEILGSTGITLPPTPTSSIPTPTETSTPTETPTPTPQPTFDPAAIRTHRLGLQVIVDTMTGIRGHNTLILTYWTDVSTSGSTGGCLNLPPPAIPANYVMPEDVAEAVPELADAAVKVNTALVLSRQTWQAFDVACRANTLGEVVGVQLQVAQTAQDAYSQAADQLEIVAARYR